MVKNNIEVDVKVKLLEAGKTQQQLGEENCRAVACVHVPPCVS